MPRYEYAPFDYVKPPELSDSCHPHRYRVAIIGAGPIGLALAVDLALKAIPSVVLDDNNVVSVGSRAICWAKRTLEIFDRLGVGKRMLQKGVTWKVGRLFHGSTEVYNFDLLPEEGHEFPAFINLQQYYVEQYLVERAQEFPDLIDLRFKNKVVDHADKGDHVSLRVETPDGAYTLDTDYMVACDGARSPTRQRMQLTFEGQTFEEKFLIADVEMDDSPFGDDSDAAERWFWFEPEFHHGNSTLLHKQPDNIYRIDFQLQPDADEAEEKQPENLDRRLKAMIGDRPYTLDWMSIYRFTCAKLDQFVHNRVLFVGDSAHVVSPFGARGGNGGIHDVDNLGWKLAAVLNGQADQSLLQSYDRERSHGSAENILNSSRATNFMTPKSEQERVFRTAVLNLSKHAPFARQFINSGRLSLPCSYIGFDEFGPDALHGPSRTRPGIAACDAPLETGFLLEHLGGEFVLLTINCDAPAAVDVGAIKLKRLDIKTPSILLKERYLGDVDCAVYLIRPDQHIVARWPLYDAELVENCVKKAIGKGQENEA